MDSAISCLSSGLTSINWDYPIENKFFGLLVQKIGKPKTVHLIDSGLNKITKIDKDGCWEYYECYYCCDYYSECGKFKIGIDETEFELAKSNREKLIKDLCEKYGI